MTTSAPAAKRPLKANFSTEETRILLEEVAIDFEREVLTLSFCNDVTDKKMRAAWNRIAVQVNVCGIALRSVVELKKWGSLKRRVKDRVRDQKMTGGGRPLPAATYEDLVVAIIGEESLIFDGINGKFNLFLRRCYLAKHFTFKCTERK